MIRTIKDNYILVILVTIIKFSGQGVFALRRFALLRSALERYGSMASPFQSQGICC